uniref:Glycine zipper domain-containing protein n=1 Tax=Amphimedon queenslandica TaxID=400682 RepID=A0A1X7U8E1_AMPQE
MGVNLKMGTAYDITGRVNSIQHSGITLGKLTASKLLSSSIEKNSSNEVNSAIEGAIILGGVGVVTGTVVAGPVGTAVGGLVGAGAGVIIGLFAS